ncbi:Prolyl-tRNA synthetase associated domain-containing protein, partial [Dysosmobacter welbionis]
DLGIRLGFLVGEALHAVVRQLVEEIHLLWDLGQLLTAGLEQGGHGAHINDGVLHGLTDIGLRRFGEVLRRHGAEIRGVEVRELVDVKNGGGLGDTGDIEGLHQLAEGEDLLLAALALGGPAQQSHIVQNGLRQITLGLQVLVGGVPVALGHLVVLVPHNGGAVDVGGDVPAEGLVQQIV